MTRIFKNSERFLKGRYFEMGGGQRGSTGGPNFTFFNVYFHYLFIYLSKT